MTARIKKQIITALFCLFSMSSLIAQLATCVQFETIEANTIFDSGTNEPGDIIFTEEGVDVSVLEYNYITNQVPGFGAAAIINNPFNDVFTTSNGNAISLEVMSLGFDFTSNGNSAYAVAFNFLQVGDGNINFTINGQDIYIAESFENLPSEIAGANIDVSISQSSDDYILGFGYIYGDNIESITVGGQNLYLDNICFELNNFNAECVIENVIAEAQPCTDNNIFYVDLDVETSGTTASTFMVIGNGMVGTYNYSDLPITLGPFESNGSPLQFNVLDNDSPECIGFTGLDPVDCNEDCSISNIVVSSLTCGSTGTYSLELNFDYENVTNEYFDVIGQNGEYISYHAYNDLPVFISDLPISGNIYDILTISDNDNPECSTSVAYQTIECPIGDCGLFDLSVNLLPCDPENQFYVEVSFEYVDPNSTTFYVLGNGTSYGEFNYNQLPVVVGPFEGNGESVYQLTIQDSDDNPDCSTDFVFFDALDCNSECIFTSMFAEAYACDDNQFMVDFEIEAQNTSSLFTLTAVHTNGETINYVFEYGQTTYTIGPLNNYEGDGLWTIFAVDSDDPNCNGNYPILSNPCEEECSITNLEVDLECDGDQVFGQLTFTHTGPDTLFQLLINGNPSGQYEYSALPISIGPLLGNGIETYNFTVVDVDDETCTDAIEFQTIDCNEDCNFTATAAVTGCSGNLMNVLFVVNANNPSSDNFMVTFEADGQVFEFGPLPYNSETYVSIPDGETPWTLAFTDAENPGCTQVINLWGINCNGSNCGIYELEAIPTECNDDGVFYVNLHFDYFNTSETFIVNGNGNEYGEFNYANLPISLGPFNSNDNIPLEFIAFDGVNPNCSAVAELGVVDCDNLCNISNLNIYDQECVPEEFAYNFILDFDYSNASNTLFDLFDGDGNIFGTYPLESLPLTIESFPSNNNDPINSIVVCINDNPNCCISVSFDTPYCSDCEVDDLFVEAHPCDGNEFMIDVEFNIENPGSEQFWIIAASLSENQWFGPFDYGQNFYTVGPLPSGNEHNWNVTMMDIEHPDCLIQYNLGEVDCNDDCVMTAFAQIQDCIDGSLVVEVVVGVANPSSEAYNLTFESDGQVLEFGPIPYNTTNFEVWPIPSGDIFWTIIVSDSENSDCYYTFGLDGSECEGTTCFSNLIATPLACFEDGTFWVSLDFDYDPNYVGSSFDVVGNGMNYGTFSYDDLPITLDEFFEGDGTSSWEFIIVDNGGSECNNIFTELGPVDCIGVCSISNLEIEVGDCNNNGNVYELTINFDHTNTTLLTYALYINDELWGFYPYDELPLTIPNVETNGTVGTVTVCESDDVGCCTTTTYIVPSCDCNIILVSADPTACDNEEMFYVELGVTVSDPTGDGYTVVGNGQNYGTYSYDMPFITLGPFPADGTTVWEFIVTDNANPECSNYTGLGPINCNDECNLFNLYVEPVECNGEGIYDAILSLGYENTISSAFTLYFNGNPLGQYAFDDLSIYLHDLNGNDNGYDIFTVCDNDDPNCCTSYELPVEFINCETNGCIGFDDLEEGIYFPEPNDNVLLIDNGVVISMISTTPNFGVQALYEEGSLTFNAADGIFLFLGGDLFFDFTQLTATPLFLNFDFAGGEGNSIIINGAPPVLLNGLTDTLVGVAPGVSMYVNINPSNPTEGSISLYGAIETMMLGGIELGLDNFCYYTELLAFDVWPGDGNYDNVANNVDLLYLGMAYGSTGALRINGSESWSPQAAMEWDGFFPESDVNFKHADFNNDGFVNAADIAVLDNNYGKIHGPVENVEDPIGNPNDPPLFIDASSVEPVVNEAFTVPIILGLEDHPVNDIYGIAFTIKFDAGILDEDNVEVIVPSSWLGEEGTEIISIDKRHAAEGEIDVAISRISQTNTSGYGPIAHFVGIIDDLMGKEEMAIEIIKITAIQNNLSNVLLYSTPTLMNLPNTTNTNNITANGLINVYPNPTTDQFFIDNDSKEEISMIRIYNTLGQLINQVENPSQRQALDVSNLPSGIYYIELKLETQTVSKKLKVDRP